MIEVSIPQDIRSYEPTLIGFLTTRQFVCGAAAVVLAYGGYMIEKGLGISDPLNFPLFLVIAVPPVLIGWMKPYGMKFETFIVQAFRDNLQAPSNRPYVVENMWDVILAEEKKAEEENMTQEEKQLLQQEKAKKNKQKNKDKAKLPKELKPFK